MLILCYFSGVISKVLLGVIIIEFVQISIDIWNLYVYSYCFFLLVFYDIVNGVVVVIDGVQYVDVDMCICYIECVVGVDIIVVISFFQVIL